MSDHSAAVIGFFLLSIWWLLLAKQHPKSKKLCLYYAIGSFVLGGIGLLLAGYRIWVG